MNRAVPTTKRIGLATIVAALLGCAGCASLSPSLPLGKTARVEEPKGETTIPPNTGVGAQIRGQDAGFAPPPVTQPTATPYREAAGSGTFYQNNGTANYPPTTYPPTTRQPANGSTTGNAPHTVYQQPGGNQFTPGPAPAGANNGQPFFNGPPLPAPAGQLPPGQLPPGQNPPANSEIIGGPLQMPDNFADLDVFLQDTRTGRLMFGVGVNSEAGVTGQFVIDERHFDWRRYPTRLRDFADGRAFRGGGQGFRLEALPGSRVQRYTVSFTEPYLFNTPWSFGISGYFFDRRYFDWDEQRMGVRPRLGYNLTHDLSVRLAARAENIDIHDPRVIGVPELDAALGDNNLYSGKVTVAHDTRDTPFAATEGHLIELSYEQVFGDFSFPRFDIDIRKYFMVHERPDTSGRHTIAYLLRFGFTGPDTPIFENYYAGGFSTLRGFDFRGASPVSPIGGVEVGGEFRFLGSIEYTFPLTADDMLKGVVFCDFGTVEEQVQLKRDNFRVAPGFGLRINIPALGPAPLAFDFAFPVMKADTDDVQIFSFFFGFGR